MDTAGPQDRRRKKRGKGLTLQVNIVTAFAFLLTVTLVTLVTFTYLKNESSILDQTERFVDRVSASGIARTVALLDPVGTHVAAVARMAAMDEPKAYDGTLFPVLTAILDNTPQLQSIYFALERDARFVQAFPIPPGTEKFGANNTVPPEGAAYALRVLDWKGGTYSDVWTYVSKDGRMLGSETSNHLRYDHRSRDWYKEVKEKRRLVWTDLVVFTSNRQPGIAAVFPILSNDGAFLGAVAANISTAQLSDFLRSLDLGANGVGILIDDKEQVIAHPDSSRVIRQDGLKLSLVKVTELNDARVNDSFAAYHRNPAPVVRFQSEGKAYIGAFGKLPEDVGKQWLQAMIVQEDDFVGTLKENTRDIVLVGGILMMLGMVGMTVISRWISKPLFKLVGEIRKIQKFDLAGPIAIHAYVKEVNELIDALNMMKRALRTFGMFIPRDLVRDLVASGRPIELGGHDRTLTVLFTDIADFTGLSERMAASDLLVHISHHLAAVSSCIGQEEGTVDKYVGDAVMAFWGAPNLQDEHALRACRAALRIKKAQEALNARWSQEGLPTLFVRIGLHTANVIVGNIGSTERMSYTAVGDGVNVASRLEGVNKFYGTQICISESVLNAAGPSLLVRPLDIVAVKGRKAGERVYELLGLKDGPEELIAGHELVELSHLTEDAFHAYVSGHWSAAERMYGRLADQPGSQVLADVFLERTRRFQAQPPRADWNGVYELHSK